MSDPIASPYRDVPYLGHAYAETHPSRLATIASLYGMEPPNLAACRLLELGCGRGNNLLPMAYQYPEARFVGIDLSGPAIEAATTLSQGLGRQNLEFRHGDIMDVTPQW